MRRVAAIFFVFTFIVSACEKEDEEEICLNETEAAYFPNTIDTYWKYERYDHLRDTTDTITVSITGDTIVSGNTYSIWEYDYVNWVEIEYVLQGNDSITVYRSNFDWPNLAYITPFEIGLEWKNSIYQPDSSFVSSVEDVDIDGRVYQNAVLIEHNRQGFNSFLIQKSWIKPGVGLVKREREKYNIGAYRKETWTLIETYTP